MEETKRTIEMAEWLVEHPWYRSEICNDGFIINDEEFLRVFRELEAKGYYELLLVFIVRQKFQLDSVAKTLARFWIRRVIKDWWQQGNAQLFQEFRELFQQEAFASNAAKGRS
ncbi:MAG: hypothetical protein ACOX7K_09165 [Oscillospiraceae bacterium]|jgi:hypothetical protein